MTIAYLNGVYAPLEETRISVMDRGFLLADGVYEVIAVYDGKGFLQEQHLERLERSLAGIRLENPHTRTEWKDLLDDLVQRNGGGDQSIYLQVTRGTAPTRSHNFPKGIAPTVLITSQPLFVPDRVQPAKVITRTDIRWDRCDIKSVALLANLLLRQEAVEAGCLEAILIRDGRMTEGAASNVFIVSQDRIMTSPNGPFLLGGITRDLIIELCTAAHLPMEVVDISEALLRSANEVWVTSSLMGIVPIVELDGVSVGSGQPGPWWEKVWLLFQDYKSSFR